MHSETVKFTDDAI